MNGRSLLVLVCIASGLVACGSRNNSAWMTAPAGSETPVIVGGIPLTVVPTGESAAPSADTNDGLGVGPVKHVDMASLDASRAAAGEQLFQAKCSACHKIGERYIGPALSGVTQRRKPEWILNQILNPENMIQQDPVAKSLLAEYIAPMANQHLTRDEAESILVYFREHDAAPQAATEAQAPSGGTTSTVVK